MGSLDQEDRDLLAEIGGAERLLDEVRRLRGDAAFALAGLGGETGIAETTGELSGAILRQAKMIERQELERRLTAISGEVRPLKQIAKEIGVEVGEPIIGFDEGTIGIREAAAKLTEAKSYTIQNEESVANTCRRWIEAHGDIPIAKWTRAHIDQLDDLLTGMPSSTAKDIRSAPLREAILRAERDELPTVTYKTREAMQRSP